MNVIWIMVIVGFIVVGLVYVYGFLFYDLNLLEDFFWLWWLCMGISVLVVVFIFIGIWNIEVLFDGDQLIDDCMVVA